ncbi:MAG: type II toxin-antitoxin system RelE/ParE family toxin [Clostridiales bacterium]|jgi:mRNA interferase RelE/StbE|nr:type II toxin-antitoxin system RelE/ParE family toxin [Clostridiales bacterium]
MYSKKAEKFLAKLDKKTARRLIAGIDKLPNGDVVKLRGLKDIYRLRIGDFRIKFTKEEGRIVIGEINIANPI